MISGRTVPKSLFSVTFHLFCVNKTPLLPAYQKKLEKAGTVDFKKHPARKVGTWSGSVDPRFPAGVPFPVSELLEFVRRFPMEPFLETLLVPSSAY